MSNKKNKKSKIDEYINRYQQQGLPQSSNKSNAPFRHTFMAIVFIFVGLVLILNNFAYLPWNIWTILLKFWPVFIVMIGLHTIAGKSMLLNLLVAALGIGLIVSIVAYSAAIVSPQFNSWLAQFDPRIATISNQLPTNPGPKENSETTINAMDYPEITQRNLAVKVEAGKFDLVDDDSASLIKVTANYYRDYGKPILIQEFDNGSLDLNLSTEHKIQKLLGISEDLNYTVTLGSPNIPTVLTANVTAGILHAKLTHTQVKNITLTTTAGTLTLALDSYAIPTGKFSVDVGAGALTIKLPYNTFAKINYKADVGIIQVDDKILRGSGSYTTPNFHITTEPMVIDAHVGAGTMTIDTSGNF